MMDPSIKNVDEYLAKQPEKYREALTNLRAVVRALVPDAEEIISYGMPMYKYLGMPLCGFAGFKRHLGFYPGAIVSKFSEELKSFKTSKGTIQFTPEKMIPEKLLRRIILERASENLQKSIKKTGAQTKSRQS